MQCFGFPKLAFSLYLLLTATLVDSSIAAAVPERDAAATYYEFDYSSLVSLIRPVYPEDAYVRR